MTEEQLLAACDQAETSARNYFKQGLNCAEAVLQAYLDLGYTDLPPEVVALATGFGGGIGQTKHTCGAVLGACMAIGTTKGRANPLEKETLPERVAQLHGEDGIYALYAKFVQDVTDQYGTIVCGEMCNGFDWEGKPRLRNCLGITGQCARLAVQYAQG